MRLYLVLLFTSSAFLCGAQQKIQLKITGGENKTPIAATIQIRPTEAAFVTDSTGTVLVSFPANGSYTIYASAVGFEESETRVTIPFPADTLYIYLESSEEDLDEVIIQSTRTSRTIANVPTRVETISLEEIDEKNNMRPANVAMLLHESTGIQVQQTSATSGNASIRIQGLDGRYTQLLKDGVANYGNFSSGLSVLEIPPLDLRQVEIIKGPASTLYGGGAIAGVVNFISKTPGSRPAYDFILNQSNIGQSNIGGFASARGKKLGYTLLALYNRSAAYDVDGDEFTEVPRSAEFTVHPKLFLYPNAGTTITIGNSFTKSRRSGGDITAIDGGPDAGHQYIEENNTLRNISSLELDKSFGSSRRLVVKESVSLFNRSITLPGYRFAGTDYNSYTDVSYITSGAKHTLVTGANFIATRFRETSQNTAGRDQQTTGGGLYGQHTLDLSEKWKLETGLRADVVRYNNNQYAKTEVFVLPRLSLLVRYSSQWSSRISGGLGYKTPTLFTEQTETIQYRNVAQLTGAKSERSVGGTADVNFRTSIGSNFSVALNHMFFLSHISHPLVLQRGAAGLFRFSNADGPVRSAGFETNARLVYRRNFKLFLGYTFTHTKAAYLQGQPFLPLVPRGKLNSALIYEGEGVLKAGLEAYFTGKQFLSDGTQTPRFSELGFMVEKPFKRFSLYVNLENFTDTRQSRYKPVVNGSHLTPDFDEIWTHTEGFVVNGGVKLRF